MCQQNSQYLWIYDWNYCVFSLLIFCLPLCLPPWNNLACLYYVKNDSRADSILLLSAQESILYIILFCLWLLLDSTLVIKQTLHHQNWCILPLPYQNYSHSRLTFIMLVSSSWWNSSTAFLAFQLHNCIHNNLQTVLKWLAFQHAGHCWGTCPVYNTCICHCIHISWYFARWHEILYCLNTVQCISFGPLLLHSACPGQYVFSDGFLSAL